MTKTPKSNLFDGPECNLHIKNIDSFLTLTSAFSQMWKEEGTVLLISCFPLSLFNSVVSGSSFPLTAVLEFPFPCTQTFWVWFNPFSAHVKVEMKICCHCQSLFKASDFTAAQQRTTSFFVQFSLTLET